MVKAGKTGCEYIRVSSDSSGRLRSPEEQHDDNERAGQLHGITLTQSYAEADAVSASQYAKKARLGFGRLMDDLRNGRFGADVLVLWEPSRGSRTVAEWADLIDTCRDAGVQIMITTHGRIYDPGHGRDRRTLHEDATDAEYESWKTHERVTRAVDANAAAGGPHGQVPYGYRRIYDPKSGRLIRQEADELEARYVRFVFASLRQGHTLTAIVRAFALHWVPMVLAAWRATGDAALAFTFGGLGPSTRAGRPFRVVDVRDMALRAVYAGFRVHHKGRHTGRGRWHPEAVRTKAWPALVDETTFFAVRDMLMDPTRLKHAPAEGKYLLSGTAVEHTCGGVLHVLYRQGTVRYRCAGSHVLVPADQLDEHVEREIVAYLSRPDVYQQFAAAATEDLAPLRDELAACRAAYAAADPDVHPPADMEEARAVAALRRRLAEQLADLEARERQMSIPPVLAGMTGADAAKRWAAAPMSARRDVARLVLTPDRLGQVRVLPWPKGLWVRAKLPIEERVVWARLSDPDGSEHDGA